LTWSTPYCDWAVLACAYILHILIIFLDKYKRDGKETKEIPLISTGFHSYIDHIFWYLPFSNVKQAYATLDAMEGATKADWEAKRAEIVKELTLERAQKDLSDGWRAWLDENGPVKGCGTKDSEVIRPAGGITSRVRD
jgi:hypothetical protein